MTNTTPLETESHRLHKVFKKNLGKAQFPFESFLAKVIRYQAQYNPSLADFWKRRGFESNDWGSCNEIPAIPTDVFRTIDLVSNEQPPAGVFRTSGTTSGNRGRHFFLSTDTYDASAVRHFQDVVAGDRTPIHWINIALDPAQHPDSSLSHMLRCFGQKMGQDARSSAFYFDDDGLRTNALQSRLCDAVTENEPVTIFGTAFGLADAMKALRPISMPPQSKIIQTGGFKGRDGAIDATSLYQMLSGHFGVRPKDILAEYGMTELSSQLYSNTAQPGTSASQSAHRRLLAPPWCRIYATDPQTLEVLPDGVRGLLRFIDCANIDSVAVIQTSDIGIVHADGLELLGRHPHDTPRGCSLAIEEIRAINETPIS